MWGRGHRKEQEAGSVCWGRKGAAVEKTGSVY